MAHVKEMLWDARLLTLTGPGGSGKTRLTLRVASEVARDFGDGVWLVELASLSEPVLVGQAVASVLGMREAPDKALADAICDHLSSTETLLILDNCEHLIGPCASLAETLLRRCPKLRILATSREALGVYGETLFAVPPLSLPDPRHLRAVDGLPGYEAARLFAERARAVRPDFSLTQDNAMSKALVGAGSIAWEQGVYVRSEVLSRESLGFFRRLDDTAGIATALYALGWAALLRNELGQAAALSADAAKLRREIDDAAGAARAMLIVGLVALTQHEYGRALALQEGGLALARKSGDNFSIILLLGVGAMAAVGQDDPQLARLPGKEGLELSRQLETMHLAVGHLHAAASLAGAQGLPVRAARLWGAAEGLREVIGTIPSPIEQAWYGPYIEAARACVDDASWGVAWNEGRAMSPEQAIDYALRSSEAPEETNTATHPAGLSAREIEVLRLVANGMTNAQIARDLFISPRTVNAHLGSVYHKIGSHSRAEAARFASERGLL